MSFETDMERMEEITKRLQEDSIPLEDSIKLFEEGVGIARRVEKELAEIERKVEILVSPVDEEPVLEPFGGDT
jgi:exodeoxyribonuclease VII small subunit